MTLRPATDDTLMKWPLPCARKCGKAAAMPYSTPLILMSIMRSHSSTFSASSGAMAIKPALLISTSTLPKVVIAVSIKRCTSAATVTSVCTTAALPPAAVMSAAMLFSCSMRRAPNTTEAPSATRWRAVAAPRPLLAPVMTTTFPAIACDMMVSLCEQHCAADETSIGALTLPNNGNDTISKFQNMELRKGHRMLNRLEMLRIFCAAAKLGSFKEAATRLGISPQAVTRAVQELERLQGELLFHRNTRQVQLSEFGAALAERARSAVEQIDTVFEHEENDAEEVAGLVRLTAPAALSRTVILPALTAVAKRYPKIAIDLRLDDALADVVNEKIDIG